MKAILFLSIIFLTTTSTISQNLVNNRSFEDYDTCPFDQGDFFVTHWNVTPNSGNSSPDFFNACAPFGSQATVPTNIVGFQEPYEGSGYVGFFVYGGNAQREYVQTQLISPLIAGETYTVSFYVSFADKHGKAIDSLGAYFSEDPLEGNGEIGVIEVEPQFENDFVVTDKENWTFLSGSFVADGGEEYVTIGNFNTDEDTQIIDAPGNPPFPHWGFYLLDYVTVSPGVLGVNDDSLNNSISIYPNPFIDNVTVVLNGKTIKEIKVFDALGSLVFKSAPNKSEAQIDLEKFSTGIYFLEVKDNELNTITKKIIKN